MSLISPPHDIYYYAKPYFDLYLLLDPSIGATKTELRRFT